MPELPEVENTKRYLIESGVIGATIRSATVTWANSVKFPSVEDFVLDVQDKTINGITRRGKYLILSLDSANILVLHLGMTGGLVVQPIDQTNAGLVRHWFDFYVGRQLRFIDPRKFGHLWLLEGFSQIDPNMGPEPLDPQFTSEVLVEIVKNRKVPIKALLLEQSAVAGLGNLYADESLFVSGIHPACLSADLNLEQVECLHTSIVNTLKQSLDIYDKDRAEFGPSRAFGLPNWTMVRNLGAPCVVCSVPMEMIRVRNRSSYYCPNCQKAT